MRGTGSVCRDCIWPGRGRIPAAGSPGRRGPVPPGRSWPTSAAIGRRLPHHR